VELINNILGFVAYPRK